MISIKDSTLYVTSLANKVLEIVQKHTDTKIEKTIHTSEPSIMGEAITTVEIANTNNHPKHYPENLNVMMDEVRKLLYTYPDSTVYVTAKNDKVGQRRYDEYVINMTCDTRESSLPELVVNAQVTAYQYEKGGEIDFYLTISLRATGEEE